MLGDLRKVLEERGVGLSWDDSVLDVLTKKSYSVTYGARNLRRTIQREIEDPIAEQLIDTFDHPGHEAPPHRRGRDRAAPGPLIVAQYSKCPGSPETAGAVSAIGVDGPDAPGRRLEKERISGTVRPCPSCTADFWRTRCR